MGETVFDDLEYYHIQRLTMDSMLCRFRTIYPVERIDSVRHLLEDKELQMRGIVTLLDEQQTINEKMARQVPVIVQRSVQEQPKKTKRKGFLGIFGKKEEIKLAVATTMLRSLNQNMIAKLREQSNRLSEHADSLTARNTELNRQLQSLICQIDDKVQTDLHKREVEIAAMREQSFIQIGGLTGFVLLLLVISYIIIQRNANCIKRYKRETTDLIEQLHQSIEQNETLIASRKKAVHTIRLESKKGKGSRFMVEIPVKTAGEVPEQMNQTQIHHNHTFHDVIAIDNDELLLLMLKEMYNQEGIHCDTCTNAAELMEMTRRKEYSLLLRI